MFTPDQKGAIAETAIVARAVRLGIEVYRPVAEGGRRDLLFDLAGRLVRLQCKTATRSGEVVVVRCRSCRRTRDGYLRRSYTADEIDPFAAYCLELDRCYFPPIALFPHRSQIQLRLSPARNNQRLGIHPAGAFEFEATLAWYGAIAQLGERVLCKHEVVGSIPSGSTRWERVYPECLRASRAADRLFVMFEIVKREYT